MTETYKAARLKSGTWRRIAAVLVVISALAVTGAWFMGPVVSTQGGDPWIWLNSAVGTSQTPPPLGFEHIVDRVRSSVGHRAAQGGRS